MNIKLEAVSKSYKKNQVLKNITLEMNGPKICGLLGRNGAGKTSLMKIIAGQELPTSGSIMVNGLSPFENKKVLSHLCLIKESNNFHRDMKVKDILDTCEKLYEAWDAHLANKLIELYQLPQLTRVKNLSKGMESSLGVIVGLASGAKLTIFDEPYIGMDAVARSQFYDILIELYEKGNRTFIFSTHLIDEASLLFEQVLVIKDGEIILQAEADEMREEAFAVMGKKEEVESFIADKTVLKKRVISDSLMVAYLYDREAKQSVPSTLQLDGVSLQDLMIYLTEMEEKSDVATS